MGDGLYRNTGEPEEEKEATDVRVQQGFLENSNVSSVEEMAEMIGTLRIFETYQKILDEAINELKENDFKNLDLEKNQFSKKVNMVFETDLELMFPNDFINSSKERLNLYTKLNKITGQDESTVILMCFNQSP